MNDLIADLLARLQNGIQRRKEFVVVPSTKINKEILKVLQEEEMIASFEDGEKGFLDVEVLYDNGEPVVSHFTRVSSGGQRIYVTNQEIKPIMNGRGISILSTSKGLMTGSQAKSQGIGGELICKVW
jgi:small subunit ribosomal protein S8